MQTLRLGRRGSEVRVWQTYLLGQIFDVGVTDGIFGPRTEAATREFQRIHGLEIDGIVGPVTWGKAMQLGADPVEPDSSDKSRNSPNFPPPLPGLQAPGPKLRAQLFGHFDFQPAPTPGNPEGIKILGSWQKDNITRVTIPQLVGVLGSHPKGYVIFHRKGVEALKKTFNDWENAGLLHLVRSWAGSYNPRFIRGSRKTLSNHAFGTAFDINAPWNPLGARPALANKTGSVRELVSIAMENGFAWGGHYKARPDGMHFELVRI